MGSLQLDCIRWLRGFQLIYRMNHRCYQSFIWRTSSKIRFCREPYRKCSCILADIVRRDYCAYPRRVAVSAVPFGKSSPIWNGQGSADKRHIIWNHAHECRTISLFDVCGNHLRHGCCKNRKSKICNLYAYYDKFIWCGYPSGFADE